MAQVDAMHEQNVGFAIFSMSLEFRSSLPRDVCRFAPVISREVDDMVELFKIGSWQAKPKRGGPSGCSMKLMELRF